MMTDLETFRGLETMLLDEEIRKDPVRLDCLLTDDFLEVGSSGRVFTKAEVMEALRMEPPRLLEVKAFEAAAVRDGVVLVTYRTVRVDEGTPTCEVLRSSLWVFQEGRWRMRFHQGTRMQPAAG